MDERTRLLAHAVELHQQGDLIEPLFREIVTVCRCLDLRDAEIGRLRALVAECVGTKPKNWDPEEWEVRARETLNRPRFPSPERYK